MAQKEKDQITFKDFIESDLKELQEATDEHLEELVQEGLKDLKVAGPYGRVGGKALCKGYAAAMILDERYEQHNYVGLFNKKIINKRSFLSNL